MRALTDHTRVALLALALAACAGADPRPVVVGEDACAYCRMTVADARYASQVVTRTGRVHVFDSVDCLAGYVRSAGRETVRAVWVSDPSRPGLFVAADSAAFLLDSDLRGPMGRAVAFESLAAARTAQARHGGTVADWAAVLADTSAHAGH